MLGFNKGGRMIEDPIEFTAEVEIDRDAALVFPLIDVADPQFRHSQSGAKVQPVAGTTDRFEMTVEGLDTVFHYHVAERIEDTRYSLEATMNPQLFALVKSVETYEIEPRAEGACMVRLTTLATFDAELSDDEVANEVAMMSMAVTGELEKLKTLAEDGIEALNAMEAAEMEFDIDLDLSELDIEWDDIEPKQ
ncbi:MAG: SRPBCC family protein [Pseudomonadota bacterium]